MENGIRLFNVFVNLQDNFMEHRIYNNKYQMQTKSFIVVVWSIL